MLDVRLMAKETILHCAREEKHAMGDCIRGTAFTTLHKFYVDINTDWKTVPTASSCIFFYQFKEISDFISLSCIC